MATTVTGVGIHSGRQCSVRLHRADGPLRFLRAGARIDAHVSRVASTDRAVTLAADGARVSLVEHLLAAIRVSGFYEGVVIEASAEELPILDGSALPWLEPIAELGDPPPPPAPLTPSAGLTVTRGNSVARVEPGPERLSCRIEFGHPAIGRQQWSGGPRDYPGLVAARTFGLLAEAEALVGRGLARGASLEHAIVFGDDGPLRPLRFEDEPVRHKALDALGDLALLGRPLGATLDIERGSHALHHDLMLALLKQTEPTPAATSEGPERV